jgi:hypothetical protein
LRLVRNCEKRWSAASARKEEQKRSRGLSVRGEPIGSAEAHLTLHG